MVHQAANLTPEFDSVFPKQSVLQKYFAPFYDNNSYFVYGSHLGCMQIV